MFTRFLTIFALLVFLGACSTTSDEASMIDDQAAPREDITRSGPLSDIYQQDLAAPAPGTHEDLITNIGDRIFFGYDSYEINEEARMLLDKQAEWLNSYPSLTVTVEGHCDERGTREYNLALGDRRANAVRNYFVALGIDPVRITTISYGKERPAIPGANDISWAQNRRAVMKVD